MKPTEPPAPLTVLYDGACPLCQREIAHLQGLAKQESASGLCFVDVSTANAASPIDAVERAALLARFHVAYADGSRQSGAAAFVEVWRRLPGWRWLARFAQVPGVLLGLELAYRLFLQVRPGLQRLARRWLKPLTAPTGQPGPNPPIPPSNTSL